MFGNEDGDKPPSKTGYRWRWSDWVGVISMCAIMAGLLGFAIWRFWP